MAKTVVYPTLEGKLAERGILKKDLADVLNITPRALGDKLNGKTQFTWGEVARMQQIYFADITLDVLMARNPA